MLPSSEGPRVDNRQTSPPPDIFYCPRLEILFIFFGGGGLYLKAKLWRLSVLKCRKHLEDSAPIQSLGLLKVSSGLESC